MNEKEVSEKDRERKDIAKIILFNEKNYLCDIFSNNFFNFMKVILSDYQVNCKEKIEQTFNNFCSLPILSITISYPNSNVHRRNIVICIHTVSRIIRVYICFHLNYLCVPGFIQIIFH